MHAIGVDIGGTKIAVGVVDEEGKILAQMRRETDADDVAHIDKAIADACNELVKEHEVGASAWPRPASSPGPDVRELRPQHRLAGVPAGREGQPSSSTPTYPIVVENDANAAGWAEFRFGAGREATDMLMLTVGTGLGGAVVSERELVRGKWGMAAEVGHMRVVPEGHYCGCGHEGCWEQYASGSALERDAQHAAVARVDQAGRLLELAGGDPKRSAARW